ncbi:MAG: Txe/YoeB family addiction module toxin [Cyanothece sp. SIO2G6]|nr:Txe/YoeB family addiction module toxin [Cyanothece sp. SIO2G6]
MLLSFRKRAWQDYVYWFGCDRKMCKRIHTLIEDTLRHPFAGIGKPEALKGNLQGFWPRRIDKEHRMVYAITKDGLIIIQLRHHY